MEVLASLCIAFVFYVLIPGIGAFSVRKKWRRFRTRMTESTTLPIVSYAHLRKMDRECLGSFRFFGKLEAIQGEDALWVKDGNISLSVVMKNVSIFLLPSYSFFEGESRLEQNEETLPDETPSMLYWEKVFSLPEGTRMFIFGPLFNEKGHPVFRSTETDSVFVVIYDGSRETMLRRAIWGGRQRNEYWNRYTAPSLALGSLSLFIVSYMLLRSPYYYVQTLMSLTLSMFPLVPLFPPGLGFFFLYRALWKKGRFLRAERDLLKLPLRYFSKEMIARETDLRAVLPDGETYALTHLIQDGKAYSLHEGVKIRTTSLIKLKDQRRENYYVAGKPYIKGDSQWFGPCEDPMAEYLIFPENPEKLSSLCGEKAKWYERAAGVAFIVALLVNIPLVFILLRLILR